VGTLAVLTAGTAPASAQPQPAGPAATAEKGQPDPTRAHSDPGKATNSGPVYPLGNYAPLNMPPPLPPHNFSYTTTSRYWSVTAIRPPAGSDYDLRLWDDPAQTALLATSNLGSSAVDFIAVDSNYGKRPLGDYYPRVQYYSGALNSYQIELAQGTDVLNPGASTITMGSGHVVAVRDTYLTAGTPVTLAVNPTNAGQTAELFLMGDDASPTSWTRPRSSAIASASSTYPGLPAAFNYTPTKSGWYGVVLINKTGSGNYGLIRG
jgi:hypothetical protein